MNEASAPLLNSISHLLHAFHPVCPKDQFLALYSSSSTTGDYPALYLRAAPCLLTTPSCTTTAPASTANHPAVVLGMIFLVWTRGRVNGAPPNPLTCRSPVIAVYEIFLDLFQVCPSQVMSFPWLGLQSILESACRATLSWSEHITRLIHRVQFKVFTLKRLARRLGSESLVTRLFLSLVRPSLEYAAPAWDSCSKHDAMSLERVQLSSPELFFVLSRRSCHNTDVLRKIGWPTLAWRRQRQKLLVLWDLLQGSGPPNLRDQVSPASTRTQYCLRNPLSLAAPHCRTVHRLKSFLPSTVTLFNSLPSSAVSCSSKSSFKHAIDLHFVEDKFLSDFCNRPFAQLWPGNEVRGIAGEIRLRCVCFSLELSFFFCLGMSFSDHCCVPRFFNRGRASP